MTETWTDTQTLADEIAERHDISSDAAMETVNTLLGQIAELGTTGDTDIDMDRIGAEDAETIRDQAAAYYEDGQAADPGMSLTDVEMMTRERDAAQADFDAADRRWRDAIRRAIRLGCTRTDIAGVAGISRGRVTQIETDSR